MKKSTVLYLGLNNYHNARELITLVHTMYMIYQLSSKAPNIDILLYTPENNLDFLKKICNVITFDGSRKFKQNFFLDRLLLYGHPSVKQYDNIASIDSDIYIRDINPFLKNLEQCNYYSANHTYIQPNSNTTCIHCAMTFCNIKNTSNELSYDNIMNACTDYIKLYGNGDIYAYGNEEHVLGKILDIKKVQSLNILHDYEYDADLYIKYNNIHFCWGKYNYFEFICKQLDFLEFLKFHNLYDIFENTKSEIINLYDKEIKCARWK